MQSAPGGKALHVALAQKKTDRQRKARQASRARTANGDASSDRVSLVWLLHAVTVLALLTNYRLKKTKLHLHKSSARSGLSLYMHSS